MSAPGARPAGAQDEAGAAQAVRQMFDSIAPNYDRLNHVLSASVDRLWWWQTARRFRAILAQPDAAILDVCCGTGHMTRALLRCRPKGSRSILAADFAREMLARGARQFGMPNSAKAEPYAIPIEADALHLPLRPASQDLIVSAFGFRNLVNYEAGLREFLRVLKPGGQLGILDFSEPGGLVGAGYRVYFRCILPAVAKGIGGKEGAYRYLPASVGSFPPPEEMLALMRAVGYTNCHWQPYTFGIAGLYTGTRASVTGADTGSL
ncbi:MAG TPA: ubiquinone/menaquinone biosynthesis methyltransferase [Acidobacteriaceae bacterium]|nr:ubiquinone/menaquinone biosynthesis methyltransferase [Acidobacteriaceae bacterium]